LINQHLHRRPVPLDPTQHRELKVAFPQTDWSVASRLNSIFVAATEFGDICKEYPIVFVRAGKEADGTEQIAPIAVLGVVGETNLYIDTANGNRWRAEYMPAVLRCYPFCIGRIDEQRFAVCLDMDAQAVGAPEGQPLFTDKGEGAELLNNMRRHFELLEGEIQATRNLGKKLLEHDLLRDMRFDAKLPDGRAHVVEGFLTVDAEKAQNLPDNVVGDLHRTGVLGFIQLHWASLNLMRRLIDWHFARVGAAVPGAPAPASATVTQSS
jgi:hypothetical protein